MLSRGRFTPPPPANPPPLAARKTSACKPARTHEPPWSVSGRRPPPQSDSALFHSAACERARAAHLRPSPARADALENSLRSMLAIEPPPARSAGAENMHPNRPSPPRFADRPDASARRCAAGASVVRRRPSDVERARALSDATRTLRRRRSSLLGAIGDSISLGSFHRPADAAPFCGGDDCKAPWFADHADSAGDLRRPRRDGREAADGRVGFGVDPLFGAVAENTLWVRRRWSTQGWRRWLVSVQAETAIGPVIALTQIDRRGRVNRSRVVTAGLRSAAARGRGGSVCVRGRGKGGKGKSTEVFPFVLRTDVAVFEMAAESAGLRNEWMERLREVTVEDRAS